MTINVVSWSFGPTQAAAAIEAALDAPPTDGDEGALVGTDESGVVFPPRSHMNAKGIWQTDEHGVEAGHGIDLVGDLNGRDMLGLDYNEDLVVGTAVVFLGRRAEIERVHPAPDGAIAARGILARRDDDARDRRRPMEKARRAILQLRQRSATGRRRPGRSRPPRGTGRRAAA